jgi:hypothetical protein|tara:strand:- start:288 stop:473 length:186 start_codon:yes stop_codon:yes gene_type:complete
VSEFVFVVSILIISDIANVDVKLGPKIFDHHFEEEANSISGVRVIHSMFSREIRFLKTWGR